MCLECDKIHVSIVVNALMLIYFQYISTIAEKHKPHIAIITDMERAQNFSRKEGSSKKKRKSRTAFTNAQIFELEKRFLYQKYLSPADRDEIALGLGLSNGQV